MRRMGRQRERVHDRQETKANNCCVTADGEQDLRQPRSSSFLEADSTVASNTGRTRDRVVFPFRSHSGRLALTSVSATVCCGTMPQRDSRLLLERPNRGAHGMSSATMPPNCTADPDCVNCVSKRQKGPGSVAKIYLMLHVARPSQADGCENMWGTWR